MKPPCILCSIDFNFQGQAPSFCYFLGLADVSRSPQDAIDNACVHHRMCIDNLVEQARSQTEKFKETMQSELS